MSNQAFDIAELALDSRAEKGALLDLRHPVSHKPLNVRIWLRGTDAPSYRAVVRQQIDQQITEGRAELSAAELEARHVARLVAATIRWEGVSYQGQSITCTPENVQKLYREQLWIAEQVARFVEDRAHFLPA